LILHEGEQIGSTKATLPPATDSETRKPTGIGPPAKGRLADVEELSSLLDVQEFVSVTHPGLGKGFIGKGFTGWSPTPIYDTLPHRRSASDQVGGRKTHMPR
jgi:hypothetical protein